MARKQLNVNFNQSFYKQLQSFNNLTFNDLTDLANFILTLLHTVSKIGMYGLLYILTYSL